MLCIIESCTYLINLTCFLSLITLFSYSASSDHQYKATHDMRCHPCQLRHDALVGRTRCCGKEWNTSVHQLYYATNHSAFYVLLMTVCHLITFQTTDWSSHHCKSCCAHKYAPHDDPHLNMHTSKIINQKKTNCSHKLMHNITRRLNMSSNITYLYSTKETKKQM